MEKIELLINWLQGLDIPVYAKQAIFMAATLLLAWLANIVLKKYIVHLVHSFAKRSKTNWDDVLVKRKVFYRLSHLAPAIIIYTSAAVVFPTNPGAQYVIRITAMIYMVLTGLLIANSFLNGIVDIYRTYEFSRKMPIHGFIQVVKIILVFIVGITVLSFIVGKDPSKLLAGLGAMTAVLMLIFKDPILGFVAGIQLAANSMVHLGDWIEMPKYGADGDVIDISLTTVKVQNWDKTISMVPAYALVSDTFKNWRGMSQSGGRRIKRSINIDMSSIRFCDEQMLQKFRRFQFITEYIDSKKQDVSDYNQKTAVDDSELVNGRRLTNIGTFRAYIVAYLKHHPKIHKDMTFLIRQLQPTAEGLPIQIYVFSNDTAWVNYEGIQADIFDHILAIVPEFGLRVFQNPTGADFQKLNA